MIVILNVISFPELSKARITAPLSMVMMPSSSKEEAEQKDPPISSMISADISISFSANFSEFTESPLFVEARANPGHR